MKLTNAKLGASIANLREMDSIEKVFDLIEQKIAPDICFVGALKSDNLSVETILVRIDGTEQDNFSFEINGTPCASVLAGRACFFSSNVQRQFPDDRFLVDSGVRSYLGFPLFDSKGMQRGVFSIMSRNSFKDRECVQELMEKLLVVVQRLLSVSSQKELNSNRYCIGPLDGSWRGLMAETVDQMPVIFFVKNLDGRYLHINPSFTKLTHRSRCDVIDKTDFNIFPNEIAEAFRKHDALVIRNKEAAIIEEVADGSNMEKGVYLSYKFPYLNAEGDVVAVGGTKERSARIEAESRLDQALAAASVGVWELDLSTNTIYWDKRAEQILNAKPPRFGRGLEAWFECVHLKDRKRVSNSFYRAKDRRLTYTEHFQVNSVQEERYVKVIAQFNFDEQRGRATQKVFGVLYDQTEDILKSRALEEERLKSLHSAKLVSLGEIAAGMAHEINNPLAIVAGFSEVAEKAIKNGSYDKAIKALQKIRTASSRAGKIIQSLKAYAKDDCHDERDWVSFCGILNQSQDMFAERLRAHGVEFRLNIQSESADYFVHARPNGVVQIITNLILNSFHEVRKLDEKWIEISVSHPADEDYIVMMVRDSGRGIPEEYVNSIFNPFFTTKPTGIGTGLGLSICKGIAEDNGGTLEYSLVDGHTAFLLKLRGGRTEEEVGNYG